MMATLASAATADPPTRPNIVVILADDMGFSDLGCYGGEIRTPNLDALAAGGLRFTQFYNTARCCPTRASLLTGLYPHQAGVGHMMEDRGLAGYRGDLNRRCVTIAEALQAGRLPQLRRRQVARHPPHPARTAPKHNWPLAARLRPLLRHDHRRRQLLRPVHPDPRQHADLALRRPGVPAGDATTSPTRSPTTPSGSSATTPKDHQDRPFFLYVAYTAAHWPMHALPGGHRPVQGQVRRRLRADPQGPVRAGPPSSG